MGGRPFFWVSCAVDSGLLSVLREHIAPRLKAEAPNQPTQEQLEVDRSLNVFAPRRSPANASGAAAFVVHRSTLVN
jgi:hypothetical protein